jgi:uncharacterized lipoprotein
MTDRPDYRETNCQLQQEKAMFKKSLSTALLSLGVLGLAACDVQKTQEGSVDVPKYEVEKKQEANVTLPKYDVTTPDVALKKEEKTVEVPTIKKEEKTVEVPKVEVTPAKDK